MTKSFATQILEHTVDLLEQDLRNLTNPDLVEFYGSSPRISDEDVSTLVDESVAFRSANGLPAIARPRTASQIARPLSAGKFRVKAEEIGIEAEYVEELFAEDSDSQIPPVGDAASFAALQEERGATLSVTALRASIAAVEALANELLIPTETLHIQIQVQPQPLADEIDRVASGTEGVYNYIRAILRR